jgi:hypothetical protein
LQSSELTISQKEIKWLLDLKQVKAQAEIKEFYENILNQEKPKRLVTFGENAVKESDRIRKFGCFTEEIMYFTDQYGMLTKILKIRQRKERLSKSNYKTYNFPKNTLPLP